MNPQDPVRRPLASRNTTWAALGAKKLANWGVKPNAISIASIFFAACAGASYVIAGRTSSSGVAIRCWILGAVFVQGRLLCNLFDGMVAIEGGFRTKSGEVYNDFPDRISDALILIPAGYASGHGLGPELGWCAALLAILTAYVRVLGGSCGGKQHFIGPMAKPHRMATVTIASLVAVGEIIAGLQSRAVALALAIIILGSVVTVWRRCVRLLGELESR